MNTKITREGFFTGQGRTKRCLEVANSYADEGKSVLFISIEELPHELCERYVETYGCDSSVTRISFVYKDRDAHIPWFINEYGSGYYSVVLDGLYLSETDIKIEDVEIFNTYQENAGGMR